METGGSGSTGRFVRTGVNVTRGLNFGRVRVAPIIIINDTSSEIGESDNNQVSQTNESADYSIILMPNSSDGESSNDDQQTEGANANESQGTSDGKIAYDNKKQKVNSDIASEIQEGQSNIQVVKPSNETADHSVILMPSLSDGERGDESQQAGRAANSDTEHTNESEGIGKSSQDQQVNTDQGDSTKNATTQKGILKKPRGKRTDKLNPRKVTTSLLDINIKSDIKAAAETVIKNIKPEKQFQASKTSSTNSSTESLYGNKDPSQIGKKAKTQKIILLGEINEGASTSKEFAPKPNPISTRKSTTNEDSAPKISSNELIRRLIKRSVVRNATKTPKAYRRASKGIQTSHFATLLQKYVEISKRKKAKPNDKDSDDEVIYTAEDFHNDLTKNTWRGILRRLRKWQPSKNNILWWFIEEFIKRFKPPGFKEAVKEGISLFMRFYWVILTLLLLYFGTHYVIQDAVDNHQLPTTFKLNRNEIDTGNIPFFSQTFCSTCAFKTSALLLAEEILRLARILGSYIHDGVEWTENEASKLIFLIHQRCSDQISAKSIVHSDKMSFAEQTQKRTNVTFVNDPTAEASQKIIKFLQMGESQLEDDIIFCAMDGKQIDCQDVVTKTQTEYGTCYTWNKFPDKLKYKDHNTYKFAMDSRTVTSPELKGWQKYSLDDLNFETGDFKGMSKNTSVIKFQKTAGIQRGLTVVLANPTECACRKNDGLGWITVAHMPTEEPDMSKGTLVAPNTVMYYGVVPRITMGDPDIKDLTTERRGCVYSNQVKLRYFHIYTESNCLEECVINAILKDCKCVEFFRAGPSGKPLCKPSQYQCIKNVTENLRSKPRREVCPKCLPECTRITLRTESSSTPLDPENTLMKQFQGTNQTYSMVRSGYVVSTVPANLRKMELTTGQQIAQVGGTYGLTNGFSIIDVLRFLYAFIWLMYELWKRKILQYMFRAIKNVFKRIWRSLKKKAGCKIEEDPKTGQDDNDNPEMDLQIKRKSDSNQVEIDECNLTIEMLAKIKMLETKLRKKNREKRVKRSQKQKQMKPQQTPTALNDYISDEEPATQLLHVSVAQLEKVFQDWNNAREERRLRDEEAERILAPPLIPIPWKPKSRISEIRDRFARRRPGTTGHTGRTRAEAAVPEGTFRRQGAMRRRRGHTRTHIYWPRLQAASQPTINYTTD